LNIHLHVLFLDGVYVYRDNRPPHLQRLKVPDKGELEDLVHLIGQRAGRCLERLGLLEHDAEHASGWNSNPLKTPMPRHKLWAAPYPIGSLSAHSKAKKR
jgi:Putative transposase